MTKEGGRTGTVREAAGSVAVLMVQAGGRVAAAATEGDEEAASRGVWQPLIAADGVCGWGCVGCEAAGGRADHAAPAVC